VKRKPMFVATSYYRGAMHVDNLRVFDNEADAVTWAEAVKSVMGGCRVYEVFKDKPPRKVKT
jgi:hypothetical protein